MIGIVVGIIFGVEGLYIKFTGWGTPSIDPTVLLGINKGEFNVG